MMAMTPKEFQEARRDFGMSRKAFGRMVGLRGDSKTLYTSVKRYEMDKAPIPESIARLIIMLTWFKSDHGYLPDIEYGERSPMPEPVAEDQDAET
jgi:hypothetical protein